MLQEPGSSHEAKSLAQSARLILGGLLSRPAVTPGAARCNALQMYRGQIGSGSGLDCTTVCTIDPVFQRVFARLPVTPSLEGSVGDSQGSVGKGALIGLAVGLGLAVAAAVVVAPGCEENESQCGLMFMVGGSALGAGIGALVGAASGPD